MPDRIAELQTACIIIEDDILPFMKGDLFEMVLDTALSSMKFELEFCFDMDSRSEPRELPEDW